MRVWDGSSIYVTRDPWLPDPSSGHVLSELGADYENVKVCDLMVPGERRWDKDLIEDIFNVRDQELIMKISLRLRPVEDCWYWIADQKGMFSVKSGYRVLQRPIEDNLSNVWGKFWKLKIPPKVKNFLWRVLKGYLPTADALRSRMVQMEAICPVCFQERESTTHIFFVLFSARECWACSNHTVPGRYESFTAWMIKVFNFCSLDDCCMAVMICWVLWTNRNNIVWKATSFTASQILNMVGRSLFQWCEVQKCRVVGGICEDQPRHGANRWEQLEQRWLKLNVDAAIFAHCHSIGMGCVIRGSDGEFVAVKFNLFRINLMPKEAEANRGSRGTFMA